MWIVVLVYKKELGLGKLRLLCSLVLDHIGCMQTTLKLRSMHNGKIAFKTLSRDEEHYTYYINVLKSISIWWSNFNGIVDLVPNNLLIDHSFHGSLAQEKGTLLFLRAKLGFSLWSLKDNGQEWSFKPLGGLYIGFF